MRIYAMLAAIFLAVPALAQDKATIQSLSDQFAKAFNAGDAAAVAALYTEDAIILPPGGDMMKGRSAIQAFWKGAAEQFGNGKLTTVDVKPLGNEAAREIGTSSFGQRIAVAGDHWQVCGGLGEVGSEWKLATDIWNTNR